MDPAFRWNRASLMNEAQKRLEAVNITDAARNVEWIFCELLKCNRASLYAYPELAVPADIASDILNLVNRRTNHEPLQYILGYTAFCGLRFEVTPDVLIPRPETELLVDYITNYLKEKSTTHVLDIGAGSGCIAVSLKHFVPHTTVYSCDVSEAALAVARRNAQQNNVSVTFFQCDILSEQLPLPPDRKFDIIVSNPPYIPHDEYLALDTEVLQHEPQLALDTGDDPLLFYKAICHTSVRRLNRGGKLFFETHCDYARDVAALLRKMAFTSVKIHQDLTARDRFVEASIQNPASSP